jgi:hypothetical protein
MDDILRRLKELNKGDKGSSPLGNVLGGSQKKDETPEAKPEDDLGISHFGGPVGEKPQPKDEGFQGVDLEAKPEPAPRLLKAGGMRELTDSDLDLVAPEPAPVAAAQPGPAAVIPLGDGIVFKTEDETKKKYMKLIIALTEEDYYDHAIDAIDELRQIMRR